MRWGPSWRPSKDGSSPFGRTLPTAPAQALEKVTGVAGVRSSDSTSRRSASSSAHASPGTRHARAVPVERRFKETVDDRPALVPHRSFIQRRRGRSRRLARDLPVQPRTRLRPLAADRDRRDPDHLRDLFQVETAEESQLDDLRLSRIALGQLPQGVVYRDQVAGAVRRVAPSASAMINDADLPSIATLRAPAGDVHQDVAHQPGRHRHEMGAVLPADVLPVHQANERFVHQGRCLKHMARTLAAEIPAGKPAKLRFDERYELVEGRIVPFPPGHEQLRDLGCLRPEPDADDKVCRTSSP